MYLQRTTAILIVACLGLGCSNPSYRDQSPNGANAASFDPEPHPSEVALEFPTSPDNGSSTGSEDSTEFWQQFTSHDAEVAFLKDGREFLKARLGMIARATKSIRLQMFTIIADESGRLVVDRLIERARDGIEVQVIVDPLLNSSPKMQAMHAAMTKAGIEVQGYAPYYSAFVDKIFGKKKLGSALQELNMRYHDKFLIIDAEDPDLMEAMTGGANIGNDYFRIQPDDAGSMWRDRDILLRGPVVDAMAELFDSTFEELDQTVGQGLARRIASLLASEKDLLSPFEDPELDQEILANAIAIEREPLQLEWHPIKTLFISSKPRAGEDLIYPAYIKMLDEAKHSFEIANSYFLPDEEFLQAMERAVQRGVKITVLINDAKITAVPVVQILTRSLYYRMLAMNDLPGAKGSLKIYEWVGDQLNNGEGQYHGKIAVADRNKVIVGSYNIDARSREFNSESVLVFESDAAAQPFNVEFDEFIQPNFSNPISREAAAQYKQPKKTLDRLMLELGTAVESLL